MRERNYGIDLLRLLSMFMVVFLHVLYRGGVLRASTPLTLNYEIAWAFEIACYCAVDCYALISGYVGYQSKFKVANLMQLWLRVVYYTVIITIIFYKWSPEKVGREQIKGALCPISTEQYWYFTAYAGMFFFIPLLNMFIQKSTKRMLAGTILAATFFFSILPMVFKRDIFVTADGYSALWLMILYIMGGYLSKYKVGADKSALRHILVYLLCIISTWTIKLGIEYYLTKKTGELTTTEFLINYTAPTILLSAVGLLLFFSKLRPKGGGAKLIKFTSPLAFSVYLIHFNPLVKGYILQDRFGKYVPYSHKHFVVALIGTVIAIYTGCILIDIIREGLFKILRIKELTNKLEEVIRKLLARLIKEEGN